MGVSGPKEVADLCQKHGVLLVSERLKTSAQSHETFQKLLVLSSATKTFYTKNSFTIIENENLRKAFKQKHWQTINMKFQILV